MQFNLGAIAEKGLFSNPIFEYVDTKMIMIIPINILTSAGTLVYCLQRHTDGKFQKGQQAKGRGTLSTPKRMFRMR